MEGHKEGFFRRIYDRNYKGLMSITFIILLLSISQIAYQITTTGDFITKGVSLKGGLTVTIDKETDIVSLSQILSQKFPKADISVRVLSSGTGAGTIIEASDVEAAEFEKEVVSELSLSKDQYSVEVMGSSLGASFFKETLRIILIAFLFMGMVVFMFFGESWKTKSISVILTLTAIPIVYAGNSWLMYSLSAVLMIFIAIFYFRYSVPSFAVILCAFSDIMFTIAMINVLGIKVSTAGIASLLMLIGYSVDTDILLSTKVLRRKSGTVVDAVLGAWRTGLVMTATTVVAVIAGLVLGQSDVLKQMMTILLIGLLVDVVFTWIQNAGILRWHLERKANRHE